MMLTALGLAGAAVWCMLMGRGEFGLSATALGLQAVAVVFFIGVAYAGRDVAGQMRVVPGLAATGAVVMFGLMWVMFVHPPTEARLVLMEEEEFEGLVPGLQHQPAVSKQYVARSHAEGYALVARIALSEGAVDAFLSTVNARPQMPVRVCSHGMALPHFHERFRSVKLEAAPEWFDYPQEYPLEVYRAEGRNAEPEPYRYRLYVDRRTNVVWLEGGSAPGNPEPRDAASTRLAGLSGNLDK